MIAPGIINANDVFLLFKGNLMGNQALFDFLQGNESYKYMLGAQDHPVYRLIATRGGAA